MTLIPTVRCSRLRPSLAFYTRVLDFETVDGEASDDDPGFRVLARGGSVLFLSSHAGDGEFGQALVVAVDDVDAVYRKLRDRGLELPAYGGSPVHQGPVDQTWGTREFYVDDPDGNTLRFVEGLRLG